MKTFIILFLIATSFAQGYLCKSLCLGLDSVANEFTYYGEVKVRAGLNRGETHELLTSACNSMLDYEGERAIVVDAFKFEAYKEDYQQDVNSQSFSSFYEYRDSYQSRASNQMRRRPYRRSDSRETSSSSSEVISRESSRYFEVERRRIRYLSMDITPSNSAKACEGRSSIPSGRIPYTGRIEVQ